MTVRGAPPAARTLLIVGHDPAVPELALTLAAAAPAGDVEGGSDTAPVAALDRIRAKFPTAAIAVLEFGGNWDQLAAGSARLTSFVAPRDLATKPAKPDRDPR